MLKQKQLIIAALLGLVLGMNEAQAKRLGGGKTSGATRSAATKPVDKAKNADEAKKTEEPESAGPSINVRLPRGSSSQTPANNPAAAVPAAAAAGAAAGAATGTAAGAAPAADLNVEARRKENEEKLARAAAEEERRLKAIQAFEEEQAEREKQLAREKAERDARRARETYENQCQFKPVMSDEEIARCRTVYKN